MLVLFTDTDTDMTPQLAEHYGYKLISMPYVIDGVTVRPYVDFDTFDAHAFYDKLRAGVLPQTCAISPDDYVQYFEPYFKNGDDFIQSYFVYDNTTPFANSNGLTFASSDGQMSFSFVRPVYASNMMLRFVADANKFAAKRFKGRICFINR